MIGPLTPRTGTCLEDLGVERVGGVVQHAAGAADGLGGVIAGAGGAVLLRIAGWKVSYGCNNMGWIESRNR
jgi:sugar phosphate permease